MVDKILLDKPKVDEIYYAIVSEPDPQKIEKEGLTHRPG